MKEYITSLKKKVTLKEIEQLFGNLSSLRVLVIGDTIIDEYAFVTLKGRASKDPILSTEFAYEEKYAGGVLAIANHISSFVKNITLVTILGDKNPHLEFVQKSLAANIQLKYFTKENAPTTIKRRYVQEAYRKHKMFKVEYMNDKPIIPSLTNEIQTYLKTELQNYDLVIVSDFGHGFLNEPLRRIIEEKAKFLALNVQSNSANMGYNYFNLYQKADFCAINEEEFRLPLQHRFEPIEQIIQEVYTQSGHKNILVTRGRNGSVYLYKEISYNTPILIKSVKDTVGAGDAVFALSSLFAYLQSQTKFDPELIPFIGNCAGAIASNIIGNKESITKEKIQLFVKDLFQVEIKQYLESVNNTISQINVDTINSFVEVLMQAYHTEKTIYIFGNGGSSATASHFCGDLVKGVSYGLNKRFKVMCLNDNLPALMAIANDISYDDIFIEQLKNFLNPEDVVIGISGSGNSTNIVKALQYGKEKGAKTVAICGYKGGKIKEIADLSLHAEINDMEVSEDVHHLILAHCVKRIMTNNLNNSNVGSVYSQRVT